MDSNNIQKKSVEGLITALITAFSTGIISGKTGKQFF